MIASFPLLPTQFHKVVPYDIPNQGEVLSFNDSVQRARVQNQRALLKYPSTVSSSTMSSHSNTISALPPKQYLTGLGQQTLPTPLAEAMRRTRFMLMGAGIVTAYVLYRKQREEQQKSIAADASALSPTQHDTPTQTNRTNRNEHVVLSLGNLRSSRQNNVKMIPIAIPVNLNDLHQMPLRDCSYTLESSLVVLQADISQSIATYFKQTTTFPLLAANILAQRVLRQKGDIATLIVGTGPCPTSLLGLLESPMTTIYMDGRGALATVLATKMEQLYNELQHVDNDKNDATKVEDFTNDTPPSLLVSTVSMVELIGSGVRRAILAIIHVFRQKTPPKQLHLLSDQQEICLWVRNALLDWRVIWYDANNEADVQLYQAEANQQSMSLVCCSHDDMTMAHVLTTPGWARIISLMEHESSEYAMQTLTNDASKVCTLSIERIHSDLLENARISVVAAKDTSDMEI